MSHSLKILFLLIVSVLNQRTHHNNIFLAQHQNYLFFTHRHLQYISTFMSICQAKPAQLVQHHPSMNIIAKFDFNNSNLGINILGQDNTLTTVFHYAKINANGICSIYQVDKLQIHNLFQFNFAGEFTKVILLDKYHAFLWNCESFVVMEYSLFTQHISIFRSNFWNEDGRNCEKYKVNMIICWGSKEINLITMSNYQFDIEVYPLESLPDLVTIILVLDEEQNIFFTCSFMICNIIHLSNFTVQILQTIPFVDRILGADFNHQTNKIVIIHPTSAFIFLYDSRYKILKIEQSIDFYSDVQCVFIENVRFLDQQILVNCNNFMGQAQHLVLIRDKQLNRFFSYQPFENGDPTNPCLFDGNIRYIFAVCKKNIITRMNNFQFFQISQISANTTITIQCLDPAQQVQLGQSFQLTVIEVQYNKVYINQPVNVQQIINYDSSIIIKPKNKFIASAIDSYSIHSDNCQFIHRVQFQNVQSIYYISLFNRQKCIQILAADNRNFYRVLEINQTTYYIEECIQIKMTYGCQLEEIMDGVLGLRLFIFNHLVFKIYLNSGDLVIQSYMEEQVVIFQQVTFYQIRDQIIRVFSKSVFYSKSIANIINNCGDWIEEESNSTYIYSQGSIFQINPQGIIKQFTSQQTRILPSHISSRITLKRVNQFLFPYLFWKGYYLFIIDQMHITKLYLKQQIIIIYGLPYNLQQYQIQSIKNVDNYIVIQYVLGFFQLYDIERESIAALIAVEQEDVLCDIILMDKDVIIVPIKDQNYVLRIQTDPVLIFGPFPLSYSMFREKCLFQITPQISNGSCPTQSQPDNNTVSQSFNLTIRFSIQQISVQNQISIINQPSQCQNCSFEISQKQLMGPIFAYEFNDDDFGAFRLISYFNVEDCEQKTQNNLQKMSQIHSSDQNTQKQLLVMNKTHLLLLGQNIDQIYQAEIMSKLVCVSYTIIQVYYLVLCQNQFIIFNKTGRLNYFQHNLSINSSYKYDIKFEYINSNLYDIYILDETIMCIFTLSLQQPIIEYSSYRQLSAHIYDFDIVNSYIVTLQNKQICVSTSTIWKYSCYNLTSFIPHHYACDYQYEEFITYFSTDKTMRALMISKTNENLHIDLEIQFQNREMVFKILNVYAGYLGFNLKQIISINCSGKAYTNFILHYEDLSQESESSIIAYYQYNSRYAKDSYIGQIRSAIFLQNYFEQPYQFSFLSFTHRLYISHITPQGIKRIKKQCILVRVQDKLTTISNYKSPPLLKFLILKAKNINELLPYYIKINYQYQDHMVMHTLIGLGSVIVIFVLLVVATNRCKDNQSELTIHFISEEIQKQYSEDSHSNSDLLHSKSSPRSNGSRLSEQVNEEQEQ